MGRRPEDRDATRLDDRGATTKTKAFSPSESTLVEGVGEGNFEDNRPTEFFDLKGPKSVTTSREQVLEGSTVREMVDRRTHHLSRPIMQLLSRARSDLAGARIDNRACLRLRHDFEFDTRVGYHLTLTVFDDQGQQIEVTAEVDPDGKHVRRESMMAKMITI